MTVFILLIVTILFLQKGLRCQKGGLFLERKFFWRLMHLEKAAMKLEGKNIIVTGGASGVKKEELQ